jgi:hypothetical protein
VAGQMSNGRPIEASSSVDVDGVLDVVGGLIGLHRYRMGCLVLSSRGEEETAIRSEGQSSEEGGQGLVVVDVCVLDGQAHGGTQTW